MILCNDFTESQSCLNHVLHGGIVTLDEWFKTSQNYINWFYITETKVYFIARDETARPSSPENAIDQHFDDTANVPKWVTIVLFSTMGCRNKRVADLIEASNESLSRSDP